MVIFHSYVKLPEGNSPDLLVISYAQSEESPAGLILYGRLANFTPFLRLHRIQTLPTDISTQICSLCSSVSRKCFWDCFQFNSYELLIIHIVIIVFHVLKAPGSNMIQHDAAPSGPSGETFQRSPWSVPPSHGWHRIDKGVASVDFVKNQRGSPWKMMENGRHPGPKD